MKQVTMESVKQRIADLESAGKVVGGLSLSSEFELELACLRELVAVTEQRDALVVENAVIDSERLAWAELYGDEMGDPDVIEKAKALQKPATDAARASLRAEGVEMFAKTMHADTSEQDALDFGRQLRESKGEVQS